MRNMLGFVNPELDCTYEAVYRELSLHLEQPVEEVMSEFSPDDAVAHLKYHRRQARRREVFQQLATVLGIDVTTVFAACNVDGAQLLLDALHERHASLV